MEKLKMRSVDPVQEHIARIGELFPHCVTERKKENGVLEWAIDFDLLKQELSGEIVEGREERYQFTWPEKRKAVWLANTPTSMTLRPCRTESVEFDRTENLYIEGDNLDVLKLLRETYLGKVKMIYIDPPYNTGADYIYPDDFAEKAGEYMGHSGQRDEQGNHLVQNKESNGRFHTDWLNMMYARLKVAKDLLSPDGAIFISIDENEVRNLGKVCDEVFGEQNFVECFVYDKKAAAKGVPPVNMVCGVHEYIYVYARNYAQFRFLGIPRSKEGFANPDNDPRGLWRNTNIKSTTSENRFAITDPDTGYVYEDTWAFSPKELDRLIRERRLIFPGKPDGQVRAKEFYSEFDNANTPIKSSLGLYDAQWNTEMLVELMGGKYFQNPKHLRLMRDLVAYTTGPEDLILDFFSGSGTTAHAVMQCNAEDGGRRRFIMVQIPQETQEKSDARKAGYQNICQIGRERIRRAGRKIKMDDPLAAQGLDTGFRVLKLDSSNMKDVYYAPGDYEASLFAGLWDNIKEDRTPEDLLFQGMLELGVLPTSRIEECAIGGKKVFRVAEGLLYACFDEDVTDDVFTQIARQKPRYVVLRDSSMASDAVAANFEQIFEAYSPDTVRKVL